MKLIYIASPLSGEIEKNISYAKSACRYVMREGRAFFAPHLLYPSLLDDPIPAERKLGMDMGLTVLFKCDELRVFGERISTRMAAEMRETERIGIPIRQIRFDTLSVTGYSKRIICRRGFLSKSRSICAWRSKFLLVAPVISPLSQRLCGFAVAFHVGRISP